MILWLLACSGADPELLAALESSNPVLRQDALQEAAEVDDPRVVAALVTALADPDPRIRLAAIRSLDELGSDVAEPAVPALLGLVDDPEPAVSRACIDALGRLADPRAAPVLVARLQQSLADPPLNALWALGEIGHPAGIAVLTTLRDHPDPYVRYNADEALRKLEAG